MALSVADGGRRHFVSQDDSFRSHLDFLRQHASGGGLPGRVNLDGRQQGPD
jgi:hypothetical protein